MSTTVATPVAAPPRAPSAPRRIKGHRNYLGGLFAWVWLAIIIIPVYYVVITTLKDQGAYFTENPLAPPIPPTFAAYQDVWEAGIGRYFLNSVIVTIGAVIPLVLFSFLRTPLSGATAGCCTSAGHYSCWVSPSRRRRRSSPSI